MSKAYVLLLFLCSIHLIKAIRIEVEYYPEADIIIKGEKVYRAVKEESVPPHEKPAVEHHEELATGATFWFYIVMVLCK
jgi:hypothetical protein